MRPIDKLDSYERDLCESKDPADHTALLMRLLMKDNGVDPDGDWEVVSSHIDFSNCDSISVEPCSVRVTEDERFISVKSEIVDGKKIAVVEPNEFLAGLIKGTDDWQKIIEVDGEIGIIKYVGVTGEGLVRVHIDPILEGVDDPNEEKEE